MHSNMNTIVAAIDHNFQRTDASATRARMVELALIKTTHSYVIVTLKTTVELTVNNA